MKYFTADSYKDLDRVGNPYDKDGKLYTTVKGECSRCGGTGYYAIGVENGQLKLHPAYNGICLKCEGKGFIEKEVRLYTEVEYNKLKENNERAKARKEEEMEKRMKAEYQKKKEEWLQKECFDKDLCTYIVTGNSYSIKDELKAAGFRYSPILKWHRDTPGDYPCIKVSASEVLDFTAWGTGAYRKEAKDLIQNKLDALLPASKSNWVSTVGERDTFMVRVVGIHGYENMYGYGRIYTFEDYLGNILKWFTSSSKELEEGKEYEMTATIKEHSEYKNEKQTVVSRPTFKAASV